MGSIFHIKNQWNILVIENYYVNYQNYQNLMLLTSSDTKRTLMHLFLFTKSAQRELVSIVCRVYATAINFPCITPLIINNKWQIKLQRILEYNPESSILVAGLEVQKREENGEKIIILERRRRKREGNGEKIRILERKRRRREENGEK